MDIIRRRVRYHVSRDLAAFAWLNAFALSPLLNIHIIHAYTIIVTVTTLLSSLSRYYRRINVSAPSPIITRVTQIYDEVFTDTSIVWQTPTVVGKTRL